MLLLGASFVDGKLYPCCIAIAIIPSDNTVLSFNIMIKRLLMAESV